jgi:hypothetical protein
MEIWKTIQDFPNYQVSNFGKTRTDELQRIFDELGRGRSYGASTTHMSKLLPKLEGGGGGGCPILVFGISRNLYIEDV